MSKNNSKTFLSFLSRQAKGTPFSIKKKACSNTVPNPKEGSPYSLPAWTEGAEKSKKRERVSRTKMKENKAKV